MITRWFGVGLGSVWNRFGIDLGSFWDRFGIDLGSVWDRLGVGLESVWMGCPMGYPIWLKLERIEAVRSAARRFEYAYAYIHLTWCRLQFCCLRAVATCQCKFSSIVAEHSKKNTQLGAIGKFPYCPFKGPIETPLFIICWWMFWRFV